MICEICNWKFWSKSYADSRRPMVIASIQVWQEMTRNQAEVIIWNFWKGGKSFVKRGRIKAALCWQTRPSMVMTSGGKEVIIWRRGVKLGPFFRTLAVWQKRAKSFLFHARAFEVGMGGVGEVVKRGRIYCASCFFAFLRAFKQKYLLPASNMSFLGKREGIQRNFGQEGRHTKHSVWSHLKKQNLAPFSTYCDIDRGKQ